MSSRQPKEVDIPLDEYIAKMNITPTPTNSPNLSEANSEPFHAESVRTESTKQHTTTPKSSFSQSPKPNVTFRNRNPDGQRNVPVRNREPYFRSSAEPDARNRINQLRNRRRLVPRCSFEHPQEPSGPSRPSIIPPSSMQRQAVVMSGPSWEQMLPFEQLQQMATSACILSAFFNLPPPPPFNDPTLFRG